MRLSSEILIDERQLRLRVEAMARAIAADTPDGVRLSVLALMDGAFMFCADLVRRLPMPVHVHFLPLRSIRRGGAPAAIEFPESFRLRGEELLVVEDILDTGRTLAALRARLERERPRRVRFAILLDKPARREVEIHPDYVGFEVDDRWVVGYGLDSDGLYRNLPYISYVEPL